MIQLVVGLVFRTIDSRKLLEDGRQLVLLSGKFNLKHISGHHGSTGPDDRLAVMAECDVSREIIGSEEICSDDGFADVGIPKFLDVGQDGGSVCRKNRCLSRPD